MSEPSLLDPGFLAKLEHCSRIAKKVISGERAIEGWKRHSLATPASGTLFQEHRSYSPGDDTRRVDWNVYGRLGELFVKVFESEERGEIAVFLDRSASMAQGETARLALELAATFGFVGCTILEGAHLLSFPQTPSFSPSARFFGESAGMSLLRALERMRNEASVGDADLAQAAAALAAQTRRPSWAIVISDFFPANAWEKALPLLRGKRVLGVQIFDPRDWDPPEQGPSVFEDPESQRRRRIGVSAAVRDRYRELVRKHFDLVARLAREHGARVVPVASTTPFETAALAILSQGAFSR